MTITKYISVAMLMLCLVSCKDDFSFHSQVIGAFEFGKEYTYADLGLPSASAFNPVSVETSGDTVFVANNTADFCGLIVLNNTTGEVIKQLTSWTINGSKEQFDNQVLDVAVNGSMIFVVNRSSRIDVFKRSDFSYITTIGKTGWQISTLLQCEAADVVGERLFIRDKQKIVVVNLADCTTENRFKVPNYIVSSDSTSANNGFNMECVAAHQGLVYISDFERSRILVVDPASAAEKDAKLTFKRSILTDSKPLSFSFCGQNMMVVCQNGNIVEVDLRSGSVIATYTSFANSIEWSTPGRISFDNDSFFLSSSKNGAPYLKVGLYKQIEVTTVN